MLSGRDQIIWNNIERLLIEKKWLLVDLASKMGVKPQAVNSLKSGARGIGIRSVAKLAKAFGVEEIEFYKVDIPDRKSMPIPVISWVHAGEFAEPQDSWPVGVSGESEPIYSYKKVGPLCFGLRIEGDSMLPRFMPGDVAVIDPEIRCDNGTACVVWVNGEVSLKLFYDGEKEIRLVPMNDRHETIVILKDSRVDFRIIGKVVDIIAKL
jgi:SOS-response transcriptional repressor LexA